jgi:hypothetical protein
MRLIPISVSVTITLFFMFFATKKSASTWGEMKNVLIAHKPFNLLPGSADLPISRQATASQGHDCDNETHLFAQRQRVRNRRSPYCRGPI